MADPWSTVPELRLNLCVYILCMVGGIVGNITVMIIMLRWVVTYNWNNKHVLFQAEVQQQEISLRYLENQPLPPLSISKYDYYFVPNNHQIHDVQFIYDEVSRLATCSW